MPYLSNAEYIDRFGQAETIRLTDELRTQTVDSEKLGEAIGDSEEEVNAYLGKRYTIPLSSAPRLVKGFVAVLARERLHKTTAPQAVKEEAERARSQLRDLSRGLATLPGETGPIAEDARDSADSSTSGDYAGSVFNDVALAGFGTPFGAEPGCWRR